ncbi:hypothetical protein G7Y89_g8113 [Cudoniella acicularis]|uniref:NACHT domain-containing protein n=1 Tax=Cudoniella acicularis TaxID=354080 RepID=A0A8H4RJY3_9HELO|nr:hypothetical protein G7Y89_g8113 [Cudoniella acicularis]
MSSSQNMSNSLPGNQFNNTGRGYQNSILGSGDQYIAENMNISSKNNDDPCLADLLLTNPHVDKRRIEGEDTNGSLLRDSSDWVLDHPNFQRWRDNDEVKLLWIKGDPGKRKTMLSIAIVDELERQLTSSTRPTALSYFFCKGTNSDLNNATAVLRGLIYLLGVQNPSLVSHLRKEYGNARTKLYEDANAFFALSLVLEAMLLDPSLLRAYFVIDAIDECETDLPQLLKFIVRNASTSPCVKWIISSRDKPEIEELLRTSNSRMMLSLELKVLQQTLNSHSDYIRSVAFSYNSELLASGSDDYTVKIWNTATGTLQQTLEDNSSKVYSVAFSHDSKLLASGSADGTVKIWNIVTGALQPTLQGHRDYIYSVAFSHDSKLLASGSADDTVKIWDVATGTQRTFKNHSSSVNSVAFSHDSKLLASASGSLKNLGIWGSPDCTVKIWDTVAGKVQRTLEGHRDYIYSVAFSHNSELLASGSVDGIVNIWDTATWTLQRTLENNSSKVYSVVFSHDSKLLASGSANSTVKIWNTVTGAIQATLEGHRDFIYSVAFSHDSKLLASGSADNTVRIWDVELALRHAELRDARNVDWTSTAGDDRRPSSQSIYPGSGSSSSGKDRRPVETVLNVFVRCKSAVGNSRYSSSPSISSGSGRIGVHRPHPSVQAPETTATRLTSLHLGTRESLGVLEMFYTRAFRSLFAPPIIWVNFETDMIYMDLGWPKHLPYDLEDISSDTPDCIKHLILHRKLSRNHCPLLIQPFEGFLAFVMSFFPKLKSVTIDGLRLGHNRKDMGNLVVKDLIPEEISDYVLINDLYNEGKDLEFLRAMGCATDLRDMKTVISFENVEGYRHVWTDREGEPLPPLPKIETKIITTPELKQRLEHTERVVERILHRT